MQDEEGWSTGKGTLTQPRVKLDDDRDISDGNILHLETSTLQLFTFIMPLLKRRTERGPIVKNASERDS